MAFLSSLHWSNHGTFLLFTSLESILFVRPTKLNKCNISRCLLLWLEFDLKILHSICVIHKPLRGILEYMKVEVCINMYSGSTKEYLVLTRNDEIRGSRHLSYEFKGAWHCYNFLSCKLDIYSLFDKKRMSKKYCSKVHAQLYFIR